MKLILTLLILSFSNYASALGSVEQGILYLANNASMGTFLVNMEAEIQKLKLNYHEKLLKENKKLEDKRTQFLIHALSDLKKEYQSSTDKVNQILFVLENKTDNLVKIENLISKIIKYHLTADSITSEINNFGYLDPKFAIEIEEISLLVSSMPFSQLSFSEFENYLFKVIEIKSKIIMTELELKDLRMEFEEKIFQIDQRLKDLK